MFTEIVYETQGHLGRITLNHPQKRNALNRVAMAELTGAVAAAEEDPGVHVLVVTGTGEEAFCSGADIHEFLDADTLGKREQNEAYRRLCDALMDFEKPIIGAVNGLALAGGAGITLLCDFVISSDRARFGFPEIKAGIFPMMVMANLFRVVGRRRGLELLLTGETIDASEAERIGLINRAVPHDRLAAEVDALAAKLLSLSPVALRLGKRAFVNSADMAAPEALNYLKEMATLMLLTEDAREGLEAILAKKKPRWRGR